MRRLKHFLEARVLPRGWKDLIRQIGLFVAAFVLYDFVRGLTNSSNPYKPFGDAMKIVDLERTLHIFVEPSIQSWAITKHWLMDAADWTYLNGHFAITLVALMFIYLRRNRSFYFVRNMFMISMGLALFGYWLFPTAPPRLMPEWGFTDAVSQFVLDNAHYLDKSSVAAFTNFYAAVPSMHVCFAVMIGLSMVKLVKHRTAKIAWCLYPVFVTFVVVATANHYLTDVFMGALTAGASAFLSARLLARARPAAWAFRPQHARALAT